MDDNFYDTLIENVRCHTCIYDKKDKNFKNNAYKLNAWKTVATATGETMEHVRRKWMMLRERYSKEIKKYDLPSGTENVFIEEWPYFQSMSFLKEFIKPRKTRKNIFHESECQNEDSHNSNDFSNKGSISGINSSRSKNLSESTDDGASYVDVRQAIKSAAESISKRNEVPCTITSNSVHENFMKSVIGLIAPLQQADQDYALSQMLQFVMELRKTLLHPTKTNNEQQFNSDDLIEEIYES